MRNKTLLISHISDSDGATPVILAKLVLENLDYLLVEAFESNSVVEHFINQGIFKNYDQIYITDLSLSRRVCERIDKDDMLKNKLKVFDHHASNLFVNEFDFATVIDIDVDGNRQSGTSLFYKYLCDQYKGNKLLRKQSVKDMVELVRQYDTWEWFNKYKNDDAKEFENLFNIFGVDYFISYYYNFLLNNDTFFFSDKERYLLDIEAEKINRYIKQKIQEIIPIELKGYKVGLVFAESYRSETGNALARKFEKEFDFIILVNISRSVSYRGVKDIDLGKFATIYGGKGHVNASGSPLPNSVHEELIKLIFGSGTKVYEKEEDTPFEERIQEL